jgi:exodeoxyribonuclease V alpha subunit
MTIQLDDIQARAVDLATGERLLVLTGGPGCGKTTICREVLRRLDARGRRILCATPTGKAAKRFSEQTGTQASTIHRLLGWSTAAGGFTYNRQNPLPCDALVLDECSMVDTLLMAAVLESLPRGASLLLVGDADQLPSIGPGNVLRDIIASGAVPVIRLEHVYRQSPESWININAQRINRGEAVHVDNERNEDFFFIEREEPGAAADEIIRLVTRTIPERHGLQAVRDIQVLCPQWKGAIGVHHFNHELQAALNPRVMGTKEWTLPGEQGALRVGDKVIHTRNDYALGVMNGEVGLVGDIDREHLTVDYDDRLVEYDRDAAIQLRLCYATTVHKSQGSEYPCVVVPVHSYNAFMLSRPLLYTAVTRGKRLVYLVGDKKGLRRAVRNNEVVERYTGLADLLRRAA